MLKLLLGKKQLLQKLFAREEAAIGYRGGFSPLGGGGDFESPLTVGRFDRLGAGTSKEPCTTCGYETCNKRTDKMREIMLSHNDRMDKMMKIMLLFQETLNTALSKRGVIPSSRWVSLYTPIRKQRRRKQVSKSTHEHKKKGNRCYEGAAGSSDLRGVARSSYDAAKGSRCYRGAATSSRCYGEVATSSIYGGAVADVIMLFVIRLD